MRRPWITVIGWVGLVVGAVCLGDDSQNRELLEGLPRDRRTALAANLERFGRLDPSARAAIRRLDGTINEFESVEQDRYRVLLQHYQVWFQGLTEAQRTNLLAITDLDARFALARKYRLAEKTGPQRAGLRIARLRTGTFGLPGPHESASLLQVWLALPAERQAELARQPPGKLRVELKAQARSLKAPTDPLPVDQAKSFAAKLTQDAEYRLLVEPMLRRVEQSLLHKTNSQKVDQVPARFEPTLAEFLYFEANRPQPVDPVRLERFAESCPDWFHTMTDSLSADDARDYFSLVYRLIYPSPSELPEPVKPAKITPDSSTRKAPRAKADPGGSAF